MDAIAQKKIAEAKTHLAEAEKSMKTSLFKRKPDLDSAASSFEKAGSCYKIAKDFNKAIECCSKAAEYYTQNNSLYAAAKQHEQVGFLANEIKNYALLADSFEKSAELMITSGTRDSAGIILERGANMLKMNAPEKALKLYKRALHVAEVEDKNHDMMNFYENAVNLALRIKDFKEAIELIDSSFTVLDQLGSQEQITKYVLTVILIHCSRDDWVAGKAYWDRIKNKYSMTNAKIEDLLEAYDEKDDEKFKLLIKNYLSFAVDNEVQKLANGIVKSEDWLKSINAHTKQIQNPTPLPPPPVQQYQHFIQPEQVSVELKKPSEAKNDQSPAAAPSNVYDTSELENELDAVADRIAEAKPVEPVKPSVHDEEDDELDLL